MNHINKLRSNLINSIEGLKVLWQEHSFKVECYLFMPLFLLLWWVDISSSERIIAIILMLLVLIVESLNTAIEIVCNRITTEVDPGIKAAKDVASAAVMLMNTTLFIYLAVILF
jgi:diacylglycerol kinase (ATP)